MDISWNSGLLVSKHLLFVLSLLNYRWCVTAQDPCQPNACLNGGTCMTLGPTTLICVCAPGFTGGFCQIDVDECTSSPCENGGRCMDQIGGYSCVCRGGFSGQNCQFDVDDCASSPCENGGTCMDQIGGYSCVCRAGFSGQNCQFDVDDCASYPCENGGICNDQIRGYSCVCTGGFSGQNCQFDVDECVSSPCENGGTCKNQIGGYSCVCRAGFSGQNCEFAIDQCLSSPCQNGGTCMSQIGGFSCLCQEIFSGKTCQDETQLPRMDAKFEEFSKPELRVNCSFPSLPAGQVQTLLSLIITKKPMTDRAGEVERELASVHIDHPATVNILLSNMGNSASTSWKQEPPTNTSAYINAKLGSFLSLTWLSPNKTEEGIYGCVARGLDNLGHVVTLTSSSLVKQGSDLERFKRSLDHLRQALQDSQACCPNLNQRLASLEWTYSRLALALAHIEKNTVLTPYEEYLTHKYYTSIYPVKAFATGKAVCEVLGGYLAEIGDSAENNVVIDILKGDKPNLPAYFMGGQDIGQEKQWRWISTNSKMNFTDWKPGEPNNIGNEDCLEMWPVYWKWNDILCKSVLDRGFICEV